VSSDVDRQKDNVKEHNIFGECKQKG